MRLLIILILTIPLFSISQVTKNIPYVQNDNFASNAFGFKTTIVNFKKHYGSILLIKTKTIKNEYDNSVIDTFFTFYYGKTKIEIYHSKQGDILNSAFIETDKIPLKFNIRIGDSIEKISTLFKTRITQDTIQIGDLEHGQVYTLNFRKSRLTSISYEGYLE